VLNGFGQVVVGGLGLLLGQLDSVNRGEGGREERRLGGNEGGGKERRREGGRTTRKNTTNFRKGSPS